MRPHPADTCRERGWTAGTRLVGDEGYGPTVIEITAVGRRQILAVTISHNGHPDTRDRESLWTLRYRDWQEVTPPCGARHTTTDDGLTVEWGCAVVGAHQTHRNSRGQSW